MMKCSLLTSAIFALFLSSAFATSTSVQTQKSGWKKFREKVKINYYGAFQGPAIEKAEDHAPNPDGTRDKETPLNIWNQVSFNVSTGRKLNFVFNPRFTTMLGSTSSIKGANPRAENGIIYAEDFLTGLQGVIYSKGDFTYWARIGTRLPTSYASQDNKVWLQPEDFNDFNYVFNPKFQVGLWQQIRFWTFETKDAAHNKRRFRLYHAPYAYYSINDRFRIDVMYNLILDHDGSNGKPITHLKRNEGIGLTMVQAGTSIFFTKDFNIYPYLAIPDRNATDRNTTLGMWISLNNI